MTHDEYAIQTDRLTKRFGRVVAVDGLSVGIRTGEVFAFLGPNGSGKTTTIRMLCGIITPTSGTGRVLGFDVGRQGEAIKERIGYMSQRFALYEDLTVQENLEFYAGVYRVPGDRRRRRIGDLLEMANLVGRERTLAGQLSGGWKQRLALGCAIVHEPPLLFLDEPTAGVDPVSRRAFWTLIYGLAHRGVTIFLTTHYLDEAEHAHLVGLMHQGRLIALDTPQALRLTGLAGTLVEVECDRPTAALAALPSAPGVREVTLYGALLHVVLDAGVTRPADLAAWLAERDFGNPQVRPIRPTLEDVFVSRIRPR
ncbi:MAG: ABC transporter ATP-binding protein [Chloroflexi bacterium]|nr:ABC transporter ATP-binding protein [Chloroflexota bacterium]